ncbi:hypothetical protein ACT6QH_01820 [Xanthobacter sp. TB0139]|uniref:hypothetical protein n=1 Tax=Xanthobacter sp. TB0139 TaxID=3459178 RepID=UPI004039E4A6
MADNAIGLHVYAITQYRMRNSQSIPLSASGEGRLLKEFIPKFIRKFSTAEYEDGSRARFWHLNSVSSNSDTTDGVIRYGSSGFESTIVDSKSLKENYARKVTDVEVIPLYFRLWIPQSGQYGLVALQTFGQRSCVGRFCRGFENGYRSVNDGYRVAFAPVVPAKLASYRDGEVKKISFFKHDHTSDSSENAVLPAGNLVDYQVTIQAKPKGNLGFLGGLREKFAARSGDSDIQYGDTNFDKATAEILIGKKRRRVTLFGVSRETGKFDLTDQVERGANGMPKIDSMRAETTSIFEDIVAS